MTLLELVETDQRFANAVKMLIIRDQNQGKKEILMKDMVASLNKMGFSASGQTSSIRELVSTFKAKNDKLIADVSNDKITLTTIPSADTPDQAEENKIEISKDATKQAMKELGI